MFKKGKGHSYNVADASTSATRNLVQNIICLPLFEETPPCSLGSYQAEFHLILDAMWQ